MSPDATPLTFEILDRFRAALQRAGAPLGDEIEPGLTEEQINDLAGQLGVGVPPELRTLWLWGTAPATPHAVDAWDINPEFELWPPAVALAQTKNYRLDETVPRNTIAFGGPSGEGYLLVKADDATAVSGVTYAFIDDPETLSAAPSLGALFELWAAQLAGGDYRYVADEWQPLDGPRTWIPDAS